MSVQPPAVLSRALFLFAAALPLLARAQQAAVTRFPADQATGVNPDTHLVLTFSSPPSLGKSGLIRIYDAADHRLVDTLDLSIPPGPAFNGPRAPSATHSPNEVPRAETFAPGHPTNANAVAGTSPDRAVTPSREYQLTIIGGVVQGFHFYPVIIHGNVATIYPHNNLLDYHRTYQVQIDPGVLTVADGSFAGIGGDRGWTFTTKEAAPAADSARVVVAADGTGDFSTVQGALDFVPDHPPRQVTIFVKNGTYEEIVFFHDKSNLTIEGEDREKVQIGYGNNSVFNGAPAKPTGAPRPGGPARNGAFQLLGEQLRPGAGRGPGPVRFEEPGQQRDHLRFRGRHQPAWLGLPDRQPDRGRRRHRARLRPGLLQPLRVQFPWGVHVDPQRGRHPRQRLRRLQLRHADHRLPPRPAERSGHCPPAR
jgi:hypothetical protein